MSSVKWNVMCNWDLWNMLTLNNIDVMNLYLFYPFVIILPCKFSIRTSEENDVSWQYELSISLSNGFGGN